MSFHCPKCDGLTGVAETRGQVRERYCKTCNHVFLTKEVEFDGPIIRIMRPSHQTAEYYRAYSQKRKVARAEGLSS